MLKPLLFLPDVKERYRVKDDRVARRIMREMGARGRGKGFFVTEDMAEAWEASQTAEAQQRARKQRPSLMPDGQKIPRRA